MLSFIKMLVFEAKKFFLIILLLITVKNYSNTTKPRILASNTILKDLVENVAGDEFEVISLLSPGIDPHTYEPSTGDLKKIEYSDVLVINGLHLEGWVAKILNEKKNCPTIVAADCVEPIKVSDQFNAPDPHIWMDPLLVVSITSFITERLIECFPEKSSKLIENKNLYLKKLYELHHFVEQMIAKIPKEKRILITTHDAFRYYGRRYGIKVMSAMGVSTDADVRLEDMVALSKVVKEQKIPAVFVESTLNPKFFDQFVKDNHIILGGKLYADALGNHGSEADTYIKMIEYNTKTLYYALAQETPNHKSLTEYIPIKLIFALIPLLTLLFIYIAQKIYKRNSKNLNWSDYKIVIDDLSCSYLSKPVLTHINLVLDSGKLYGVLGPNGAGKSTLFKSILGLVKPDSGKIFINNLPVEQVRDKIAYIPQKEHIDWTFPATVLDIVLTGRIPHKKTFEGFNKRDKELAFEALHKVEMLPFKDRQIGNLSGGQQQRVFIARALCEEAEILMFDEPFVGIDAKSEEKIVNLIKSFVKENKTVLIIHHDLAKVKEYFDFVIMINRRLVAYGPTREVFTDKNISDTYGGRLSILDEADKLLNK